MHSLGARPFNDKSVSLPHIPYLAQKLMQRLGIVVTTLGGPENCCGAFHWHFGDEDMEKQVANISLMAFRRIKAKQVLSLCPDCDYSFGHHQKKHLTFSHVNISDIFIEHLDELKKLMVHPVKRKVMVHHHEHDELRSRNSTNILRLMQAVPGLEIIDSPKSLGPGLPFEEKLKELRHLDNVDRAVEQLRPRIAKFGYNQKDVRS